VQELTGVFGMKKLPLMMGDRRKRAVVDTVRSILEYKGHDIVAISPGASVYDAIALMARFEVGALMVLVDNRLVGILSERDYARKVILQGRSSRETLVNEIMTRDPVTVTLSHTVDECLRIVTSRRIRHLPVVDNGELQGMVSIGDLIWTVISSQSYTIEQLDTYIRTAYPS
jgi:CBS domain-containing protein